ncbi:tetratricopeptide repeat protein [Azospirillum soli]|uniref:tetratricopeptide repeat protein n=1 Tax=Azospirillum soli TaxID=1304799 RepID=UPI001AEB82E3|nr:tetratricopeptide repeat protein [Azospirillum soli]MBP2314353.1 hypothetical protein [Azospirillum soli]
MGPFILPQTAPFRRPEERHFAVLADRHMEQGRPDAAERALDRAMALAPADPALLCRAAAVSAALGRPEQAAARFCRALQLACDQATAHLGLCELRRRQSRLDEAVAHGRVAVMLEPSRPDSYYNLGIALYDRLDIGQATACERKAVHLAPESPGPHFELAECLLLSGQLEEGWREYEWRFRLPGVPSPVPPTILAADRSDPRPQWDGRPMPPGRLLLVADQGFGDVIQFARYLPLVHALCPDPLIACSPDMAPILRQLPGGRRLYQDWNDLPDFDAWHALSGLPGVFGTTLETIPAATAYLQADPRKIDHWRRRLDELLPKGLMRIGIVWAGRSTHGNDHNRSMRLAQLAPLAALDGVALVSLQKGPAQAEVGTYFGRAPLVNLGPEITDFADTMGIVHGLARVVGVDTALIHLAGAMGRPASVLLPYAPDWRWLLKRGTTPWYPTVTLHRQHKPGRWDDAVREVASGLHPKR